MATRRAHAADNLMLTGTLMECPDCGDERIFVVPDCADRPADRVGDCGDYCCTDCGAAISVVVAPSPAQPGLSSRVA